MAQEAVSDTGEVFLIRDYGLLESAVMRPINHFNYGEPDVVALAVILGIGIARNHAFEQGNKRAGFAAMLMFLNANGYEMDAPDQIVLAEEFTDVVEHAGTEWDLTESLRQFVRPAEDDVADPDE